MDRFRFMPSYHYYNDSTGAIETRYKKPLRDYQISGNSFQDGTPSPDNPIEIQSVGEKTANLFDINSIDKMIISGGNNITAYMKNENGILTNNMADYGGYTGYVVSMQLEKGLYCLSLDVRFIKELGGISISFNFDTTTRQYFSSTLFGLDWNRVFYIFEIVEDTEITSWNFCPSGHASNYLSRQAQFTNIMLSQINNENEHPEFEPYGKYKIPIEVNDEIYNIFLDEPLRKCGDYADYIDFKNGKVVRNINKRYLSDSVTTGTQYANGLCRLQNSIPNTNYTVAPISNCMVGSKKLSAYANALSLVDEYKNLYAYFYVSKVGLEPVEKTTTNAEIGAAIKSYVTDKNIYFYHVFKTPTETAIELPKPLLNKGTNIIKVKTATEPSEVNWQYYK